MVWQKGEKKNWKKLAGYLGRDMGSWELVHAYCAFSLLSEHKLDQTCTHLDFPHLLSRGVSSGAEVLGQPGLDGGSGDGVFDQGDRRHNLVSGCLNGG